MNKLKEMRIMYRYTQAQVADRVGVTRGHISELERGTCLPSIPLAKKLAELFRVSWTKFYDGAK